MLCFGDMEAHSVQFVPQAWEPVWQLMGHCGTKHGECPGAASVMSPAPCAVPAFLVGVGSTTSRCFGRSCKSGFLPTANQLELGG